jgi:hypothetical protein
MKFFLPVPAPPIFQPDVATEAIYFAGHHARRELTSAFRR